MHRSIIFVLLISTGVTLNVSGQKSSQRYFAAHLVADSSSVLMFPTMYHASVFSASKMWGSGDYYANIIFYNFKTDSIRRLFTKDTYIASFSGHNSMYRTPDAQTPMSSSDIFYRVYTVDSNRNGKIDPKDPAVLYRSDKDGKNLTALTSEKEHVVSFEIFDKQGFVMIKIQRDVDGDGSFEWETDDDYYFVKLDLATRKFGPRINVR